MKTFKDFLEGVLAIARIGHPAPSDASKIRGALYSTEGDLSSRDRETLQQAFWREAVSTAWLDRLSAEIHRCPSVVISDNGFTVPHWYPEPYLRRMLESCPQNVMNVLLEVRTNNPRYYEILCELVARVPGQVDERMISKLVEYIQSRYRFSASRVVEGLSALVATKRLDLAAILVDCLVSFEPDPQMEEKLSRLQDQPDDVLVGLEPRARFDDWEYHEIVEKGVRPFAEMAPFWCSRILVAALAEMLQLKHSAREAEGVRIDDWSEVWAQRVDGKTRRYPDAKEELVNVATYACEQVYTREPGEVTALEEYLRNQKWKVFNRIRQHLYSQYPTDLTKPWIRSMILGHQVYGKSEYGYEFHRMVRAANDHFGEGLLSKEEREAIFDAILEGPSKEEFRQFVGKDFSEELFKKRRRYFHLKHFSPFRAVLFGTYQRYADELVAEEGCWPSDDEFFFFRSGDVKEGQEKSPKAQDELERMPDQELLRLINEWEDAHRDPEQWWVDISFEGLGRDFQNIFREKILPNSKRLDFWLENFDRIERPFYVRRIMFALTEVVKGKDFSHLEDIFDLCDWVLTHPDVPKSDEKMNEVSRELPCWRSSRRAVCDFVGTCLGKEVSIPIEWRDRCAVILRQLCTDYDRRLDEDEPVFLNREDQLTEAINQTRGRALENLVDFGRWVRRLEGNDAPVPEVFQVLEQRFEAGPTITLPEYALLGLQFSGLFSLDPIWVERNKSKIFQQGEDSWTEAFGNYLRFNRPFRDIFPLLRPEFEFGLANVDSLRTEKHQRKEIIDSMGEHFFAYYVWEMIPLAGDKSLFARFYSATAAYSEYWARLFDHVGRSLKNSGPTLTEEVRERISQFFEHRLLAGNKEELAEFTFWLEAEALSAEWRLKAFSRILDLGSTKGIGKSLQLDALKDLLPEHPDLVVTCFAKMTDTGNVEEYFYFQSKNVNPILRTGLRSDNSETKAAAERARENLLKAGRFEFLHVEEEEPGEKD